MLLGAVAYERLKSRDRRVVKQENFTDEDMALIEASEVSPEYGHLNAELGDCRP